MASQSDDFERANAPTLGGNWTDAPAEGGNALGIQDNQVDTNTVGNDEGAYWTADAFGDDQKSKLTMVTRPAFGFNVRVRGSTSVRTNYGGGFDGNNFAPRTRIWKFISGVATSLAVAAIGDDLVAADIAELEVKADALELFINAVSLLTQTDMDIASGKVGIGMFHTTADVGMMDDWFGGDSAAPEVPAARPAWNYRLHA